LREYALPGLSFRTKGLRRLHAALKSCRIPPCTWRDTKGLPSRPGRRRRSAGLLLLLPVFSARGRARRPVLLLEGRPLILAVIHGLLLTGLPRRLFGLVLAGEQLLGHIDQRKLRRRVGPERAGELGFGA
jgi:hypothetical protein